MRYSSTHRGVVFGCLLVLSGISYADLFQYRDRQGHVHFTDKPMGASYYLVKRYRTEPRRQKRRGGDTLSAMRKRRSALEPLIESVSQAQGLRPELVHAVIRAESAYRSDAVSRVGAQGLMQLMPATAERFGVSDAFDPSQNLNGGTRYLRQLIDLFDSDLRLALAAYNAGENAVARYGNQVPPFPETRKYVERVLGFYRDNRAGDKIAQR